MEKSKLGISVGLLGAAVYFSGILNYIALVFIAGYILLFEENNWLKKCAVKAGVIFVVFSIIPVCFGFVSDIFDFINYLINGFGGRLNLGWPLNIEILVNIASQFIKNVLLFISGFMAVSQGSIHIKPIDQFVDRHL
ncbi:MAG: hypothetical protein GX184_01350 [Clostridiaceae bacterium]|nr:hypothetical protein [Clostridiaceae bacterium]